jgi:ribosome-binding factor A
MIKVFVILLMFCILESNSYYISAITRSKSFYNSFKESQRFVVPQLQSTRKGSNSRNKDRGPNNSSKIRLLRASRILRDELSAIIYECDIKSNNYPDDQLLRSVTISDIELTADLSIAKVQLSIFGNSVERRQVFVWLCNNIGQVRHSLARRLRDLRRVPQVSFTLADSQSSLYLNEVMDEIAATKSDDAMEDIEFEEDEEEEDE